MPHSLQDMYASSTRSSLEVVEALPSLGSGGRMMGPLMSALVRPGPLFDLCLCGLFSDTEMPLLVSVELLSVLFLEEDMEWVLEGDLEKDLKKLPREPELLDGGCWGRFFFFLVLAMMVLDLWKISSWLIVMASFSSSSRYTGLMSLKDMPSGLITRRKTSSMLSTPSFSFSSLNSSCKLYWFPPTKLFVLPMDTLVNRSPL